MHILALAILLTVSAFGAEPLDVKYSAKDTAPSADPQSDFWKGVAPVFATKNNLGVELPTNRTEIRLKWTEKNFYVLMVCPYQELFVLPKPSVTTETNKLWEHDVAEIFVGADLENIHQYREYQVSPQGEWVDLDIDTKKPLPEGGWKWDSKMATKARIDAKAKVWYAEFQIPMSSITAKKIVAGMILRGNFYRFQGGPPERKMVAWKPTGRISNHTPEAFGTLRLVK
jgi:hypothetical protein